jgi:16S rRNA A1518/A1519 N6-dimethyltransferase RsmA/KsgA/DIM1 with predicted DNA glycosylase/AP lyase activity
VLVKAAFRQRRKKMSSNLKQAFPKAPVEEAMLKMGLSPNARPEELSKEQFLALTEVLKPYICDSICEN